MAHGLQQLRHGIDAGRRQRRHAPKLGVQFVFALQNLVTRPIGLFTDLNLGFRQKPQIAGVPHPLQMNLTHSLQPRSVFRLTGEVSNLMRIRLQVIQFLRRFGRRHKQRRSSGHFTGGLNAPDLPHGGALLRRVHVLVIRLQRFVVADVPIARPAHTADDIVPLIHPIARAKHKFARGIMNERPALHMLGQRQSGQLQHGRAEINGTHHPPADRRFAVGRVHDQRHARTGIIQPTLGPRQPHAVVAPEKDDRVVVHAVLFQLGNQSAGPGVHRGDQLVVPFPILAHHGGIRIIRRQRQFPGSLPVFLGQRLSHRFVFSFAGNPAFVATGKVENRKKRLTLFATAPMGFTVGLIPSVFGRAELIIRFGIVRAIIARLAQVLRERPNLLRQLRPATHVVRTQRGLVHAGDDSRSTRRAHARRGKRMGVPRPFLSQLVQMRRNRMWITVASQMWTDILRR